MGGQPVFSDSLRSNTVRLLRSRWPHYLVRKWQVQRNRDHELDEEALRSHDVPSDRLCCQKDHVYHRSDGESRKRGVRHCFGWVQAAGNGFQGLAVDPSMTLFGPANPREHRRSGRTCHPPDHPQ